MPLEIIGREKIITTLSKGGYDFLNEFYYENL